MGATGDAACWGGVSTLIGAWVGIWRQIIKSVRCMAMVLAEQSRVQGAAGMWQIIRGGKLTWDSQGGALGATTGRTGPCEQMGRGSKPCRDPECEQEEKTQGVRVPGSPARAPGAARGRCVPVFSVPDAGTAGSLDAIWGHFGFSELCSEMFWTNQSSGSKILHIFNVRVTS